LKLGAMLGVSVKNDKVPLSLNLYAFEFVFADVRFCVIGSAKLQLVISL
jgi:hypothetical protein